MKVVLDANVLLAAFGTRGLCDSLLDVCLESHQLVLSEHILSEVQRYLGLKFKLPAAHVEQIIAFLREHAELVEPVDVPSGAFSDSDDLPVLGTALAGGVDYLVTGDRKLQALERFHGIPILSPRAFYDQLR